MGRIPWTPVAPADGRSSFLDERVDWRFDEVCYVSELYPGERQDSSMGQVGRPVPIRRMQQTVWQDDVTKAEFNTAYIAHIIADKPDGPRGDPVFSEQLKSDISNLMLLCDVHHRQIDKVDVPGHPVELLRDMKALKWTPLSRPFFGRNKLRTGGSDFRLGAAQAAPRHSSA